MSTRRMVHVDCDFCYDSYSASGQTVTEAREFAKKFGSFHRSNGRDICPNCWKEGKR